MYKVEWDKETGGVILNNRITDQTLGIAPRPVFFEELDLLGLDKLGWVYPHCEEPLMWAINKQYYYRGEKLFEAKGANIYTMPTLEFGKGIEPMPLKPVDMAGMLAKTADIMFVLENEAIEFIRDTYTVYVKVNKAYEKADANKMDFETLAQRAEKRIRQKMAVVKQDCDSFDIMPLDDAEAAGKKVVLSTKIDRFIASFSGGKDSQVVLDLCTRAIPPTEFEVIYSDTGYELPPSLELYKDVEQYYHQKFPALKFSMARNHESVLNYWDKIGTPSDNHRWCCSVMKTVPLYRMLRSDKLKNTKFLAFEGVRAEESTKRSEYNRLGKGVKHNFVINARPILRWNTTEVFLYLFRYNLPINGAYRVGKPRVGCVLCPFGSPWDDMIVNRCYHDKLHPFISRIEEIVDSRNIPNKEEYIADRRWKLRSSGKFTQDETVIKITTSTHKWEAKVKNSKKSIFDWLPAVGRYSIKNTSNTVSGELQFHDDIYQFDIKYETSKKDFTFSLYDDNNIQLRYLLRRVINKVSYCINCEACELECPTGALSILPDVQIDTSLCTHCHKCLEYHNVGCIVADSLSKPSEYNLTNMKISKYGTFGIHDEWVEQFLLDSESFWKDKILGTKQVPSFKAWLKDAEIIDDKGELTSFGTLCKKINEDSHSLLWELIYINLVYNSPMMKWYASTTPFNADFMRKELDRLAIEYFQSSFKESTITYAVQALMQSFKYSPIGDEFSQCVAMDAKATILRRNSYDNVSSEAIAYSLYKYAASRELKMLRVSDLYRREEMGGIYREFGISQNELLKSLRFLSTEKNRVLIAELTMGLDHITLRDDLTPITVLETLLQ